MKPLHASFSEDERTPAGLMGRIAAALHAIHFRNCLLLAAIPIIMSAINASWIYTFIGYLDPWVNVGYFLHYADPTYIPMDYKIARLSWIIPGFIAHHLFQPLVASYLLHMGCLLLSVIFFYLTVARLFDSVIAFSTAVCFVVFVPFHSSGGWDYQNAPAGAYYIIAFYLVTRAVMSKDMRLPLIGAGVAYAAAIHATVGFVNMLPVLAAHFFVLHRQQCGKLPSWNTVLQASFCVLLGGIALTLMLGLINVAIGREFWFFKVLLDIVMSRVLDSRGQAAWWLPWSSKWYMEPYYLEYCSFLFAVLVGCASSATAAIVQKRINPIALSLQAEYCFAGLLWIIWQSMGQVALEPDHFAYPLYPVMFFGVAGIAATWHPVEHAKRTAIAFYLLVSAIAVTSLSFPFVSDALLPWAQPHFQLVLILSILIALGLFAISRARPAASAVAVFAFATANGVAAGEAGQLSAYRFDDICKDRASETGALVTSSLFLNNFVPYPEKMFVWWDRNEILHSPSGCELSETYFGLSMANIGMQYLAPPYTGMPEPEEIAANYHSALLDSTNALAVPTADYRNIEHLIASFDKAGVPLEIRGKAKIRTAQFNFDLYVLGSQRQGPETMTNVPLGALQAQPGTSLWHRGEAKGLVEPRPFMPQP
jgi:hypothetical protein